MSITAKDLKVKIFADGADKAGMLSAYKNPMIKGLTTNPTLMRKAGISDYEAFARDILVSIPDRDISFEVFSDEFDEMYTQALKISGFGANVYVKIPVMNTRGESSIPLLRRLVDKGVKVNVTALFTYEQIDSISETLGDKVRSCISVFAGRIADAGLDPLPYMKHAVAAMKPRPNQELIWASPRELYNVVQAHDIGCHIITVTNDLIAKLPTLGKDLHEYSQDTVKMFRSDAVAAGYNI